MHEPRSREIGGNVASAESHGSDRTPDQSKKGGKKAVRGTEREDMPNGVFYPRLHLITARVNGYAHAAVPAEVHKGCFFGGHNIRCGLMAVN